MAIIEAFYDKYWLGVNFLGGTKTQKQRVSSG